MDYSFEDSIRHVADQDVEGVIEARVLYGDSWRAEGGFSAFFNIKRKIDRFVNCCKRPLLVVGDRNRIPYDVFSQILFDLSGGGETVLDTVRDLRRYLLLVEAFLVQEGTVLPLQRDNLAAALKKAGYRKEVSEQIQDLLQQPLVPSQQDTVDQKPAMWGEDQPSAQLLEPLVPEISAEVRGLHRAETYTHGYDPLRDGVEEAVRCVPRTPPSARDRDDGAW